MATWYIQSKLNLKLFTYIKIPSSQTKTNPFLSPKVNSMDSQTKRTQTLH